MPTRDSKIAESEQPSRDLPEVVECCNRFGFDLYSRLGADSGNLFFSPASISMALAMTYAGASGTTAEEMAHVLHVKLPDNRFHRGFFDLRNAAKTGRVELRLANRLCGQSGYHFLPDFLETTERYYGAALAEVLIHFIGRVVDPVC